MVYKTHDDGQFWINNTQIECLMCKNRFFDKKKAMLNTTLLTFLRLDWVNKNASMLICRNCHFIHWFNF